VTGLVLLALAALLGSSRAGAEEPVPYRDLSTQGAAFLGPGRELSPPDTLSVVRLGLTGPSSTLSGLDLQAGVALAVDQANRAGGYRGLPYRVVFLPDDGPWGRVAAQVIALIREHQVWAVIGGLDGERAHAAELVAAKLWAPVITPGAGDLTIDYANVPWVFRLMPDDRAQADLLVRAARERGWRRLALLTEGTRDGRTAGERVAEAVHAAGLSLSLHLEFSAADPGEVMVRLARTGPDAVIAWARPASGADLLLALRRAGVTTPLLVPAPMVCQEVAAAGDSLGEVFGAAPLDLGSGEPRVVEFRRAFADRNGREPSPLAAYAYEAARVVIAAVERAGLNRARIRDELAATRMEGVTGMVTFDGLGGYRRDPVLVSLVKGHWTCTP
jgi:ABC-type branched-subunit amino acid transport system substrate-binding protein